jgi:ketosteroid isomerase-like protein
MSSSGSRNLVAGFYEDFKSGTIDVFVEHMCDTRDSVIVEGRFVDTHTGPLAGPDGDVEPTGASVDLRFADISRVQDGKIAAYHTYYEQPRLLTQLGLIDEGPA